MHTEYHRWHSPSLGHDIEVMVYGHWGPAMLMFPCAGGSFHEAQDFGMVGAMQPYIDAGRIKLITVGSIDHQTWLDQGRHPFDRAQRHEDYDRAIVHEVVPLIRGLQHSADRIIAAGCSLGAYHAVNFALRHPDVFGGTVALSGIYTLKQMVGDTFNDKVYHNSPIDYLPGLSDPWFLDQIRSQRLIVCCGQGAWEEQCLDDTKRLAEIFHQKGINAWVDLWGHDVNHDWPWWLRQMPYFLDRIV